MEITITNLRKQYGNQFLLNIDQLTISKGDIVGLVGNNGAGKTTMLNLILDLIKADSGHIYSRGVDVSKDESWKLYTSAYMDTNFLVDFLTPEEYFRLITNAYGRTYPEHLLSDDFYFFTNGEIFNQKKYIQDFSSGNKQKIGIIGSILPDPDILILDEPYNFLDPSSQFFLSNYLQKINQEKSTTIILSSHNLECIYNVSNHIIVLEKGEIIQQYNPVDNNTREELREYFKLSNR